MAKPAPRSTKVKHPDFITKTLRSASGDSRPKGVHQLFCGSWMANVPILWVQLGISACFWAVLSPIDSACAGKTDAIMTAAPMAAGIPKRMTHLIFNRLVPRPRTNPRHGTCYIRLKILQYPALQQTLLPTSARTQNQRV